MLRRKLSVLVAMAVMLATMLASAGMASAGVPGGTNYGGNGKGWGGGQGGGDFAKPDRGEHKGQYDAPGVEQKGKGSNAHNGGNPGRD